MKIEKSNIGGSVSWVIEDDNGDTWRYADGMIYRTEGAEGCAVVDLESALEFLSDIGVAQGSRVTIPCPPPADWRCDSYNYHHQSLGHYDPAEDERPTVIPVSL